MRSALLALALLGAALPATAVAQTSARRPATRPAPDYPDRLQIRPFVSAGTTWFTASQLSLIHILTLPTSDLV